MISKKLLLVVTIAALIRINAPAAVRYVDVNSSSPTPPYTTWGTAATVIQDAIDAADPGDVILVTNGVYQTGGRAVSGPPISNRVLLDKPLTVQSVNGPLVTTIKGAASTRCSYLVDGAVLSGFTLRQGRTPSPTMSTTELEKYAGAGVFCLSTNATVTNCILTGNISAMFGGGAYRGMLENCIIASNSAVNLTSALGNTWSGGGAQFSLLKNCVLVGNFASYEGGGALSCTLYNCTVTGNSAGYFSGGVGGISIVNNSIIYYNAALSDPNGGGVRMTNTCITPLPGLGNGNFDTEPGLASFSHIGTSSPCRAAGNALYATGTDIDGEPWAGPPSIGADENQSGTAAGPLAVSMQASYTNFSTEFNVEFRVRIDGVVTDSRWEFGDGTIVSNRVVASHSWAAPGDYLVVLRAYNNDYPTGKVAEVIVHVVEKPVFYVALDSAAPLAPFDSWNTAARDIQSAVDAASVPGSLVLVSNGVYQTGGRIVYGSTSNRVVINKPVIVQSLNGPAATTIKGFQMADTINGTRAIRCVYLSTNSALIGFTLTNGATMTGSLDVVLDVSGGGVACEAENALVSNCVLTGNSTFYAGGGAYRGTLRNCFIFGNSSAQNGGGAGFSVLNNCTVIGNSASSSGGLYNGMANNSLVVLNWAGSGSNYNSARFAYSCTAPLPTTGVGNIAVDPELANFLRLSDNSPCRGAGAAALAEGADIDGESWLTPPSMGCDEIYAGTSVGPLNVSFQTSFTDAAPGLVVNFIGYIDGRVNNSRWEFGDGTIVSNRPYAAHSWSAPGDYPVVLRAFNETFPDGVSSTTIVHIVQQTYYVALTSTNPVAPYFSWETAATNIQDAINVAAAGSTVVVSNGVYETGGRIAYGSLTSRVAVIKPLTVKSASGPGETMIKGYQMPGSIRGNSAVRCVYLTNGSALFGFTLTNGATRTSGASIDMDGGGAWCESSGVVVSNCVVVNNAAVSGGGIRGGLVDHCILKANACSSTSFMGGGGGAFQSTLYNCVIFGNSNIVTSSNGQGGGASYCALYNCTVVGNVAKSGSPFDSGGLYQSFANGSIVYYNRNSQAPNGGPYDNYDIRSGHSFSCTIPAQFNVVDSFTNPPLFVSLETGDLRLSPDSPCINAGVNRPFSPDSTDLDGNPRIVGGTADVGAYEFQLPTSTIAYFWLQKYNLPQDGSLDDVDLDGDGFNNHDEWIAGTVPNDALSALRMSPLTNSPAGITVAWQSVRDRRYYVERSTNLLAEPAFTVIATNPSVAYPLGVIIDKTAVGLGPYFYRVQAER